MSPIQLRLLVLSVGAGLLLLFAGPIAQPQGYHDFADQRMLAGIGNAADVLSNLPFLIVGLWGLRALRGVAMRLYRWFFVFVALTALGSGWYHLGPDNDRLVLDRLPIAWACVALLLAWLQPELGRWAQRLFWPGMALATFSVGLWYGQEQVGHSDLRLYLYLQFLPMLLLPAVLCWRPERRRETAGVLLILGLYLLAKILELTDHRVFAAWEMVSGHTLKHLLAALAALLVIPLARKTPR